MKSKVYVYDPLFKDSFYMSENELILFAEDEAMFVKDELIESKEMNDYYLDETGEIKFNRVSTAIEFLIARDIEVRLLK